MCVTCGCSDDAQTTLTNPQTGETTLIETGSVSHHSHTHTLPDGSIITHSHTHSHAASNTGRHPAGEEDRHHSHTLEDGRVISHSHPAEETSNIHAQIHNRTIALEKEILGKNDLIAAQNRGWFKGSNILALNLVSSPGAGKTTLLVRTINDLKSELTISVIEGDQETANDAKKIRETGCKVIQINTGTGCHLEAAMVERGCTELDPPLNSVVAIENVGNLVCPALFDLGERAKVAILSVTEGEDKPIKYPHMFRASEVMIITKIDLLPYVEFELDRCIEYARMVNPDIRIFQLSATTGEGLNDWYDWLRNANG